MGTAHDQCTYNVENTFKKTFIDETFQLKLFCFVGFIETSNFKTEQFTRLGGPILKAQHPKN